MKKSHQVFYLFALAILVLAVGASIPVLSGSTPRNDPGINPMPADEDAQTGSRGNPLSAGKKSNHNNDDDDEGEEEDEEIPFDEASIFLELNHTDGDLGIHALIDGDAWKLLQIESPDEKEKLRVVTRGSLKRHGLTELFFESDEPKFHDELEVDEFFDRFPDGVWEISGITVEGDELESEVELSHVLAEPPGNIMINLEMAVANCDVVPLPVVSAPVTIDWDEVMFSHPDIGEPGDIEVEKYQFIVEREEPTLLVLSVDLPPGVTEFEIPEDFTDLGEEFKFEIVVRTTDGNQTAVESCFELE